jgi:hypothetical protein
MTIKDVLTDESKWHKGDLAMSPTGARVSPNSPSAFKFCLLGALEKCYTGEEYEEKKAKLYEANQCFSIVLFNDSPSTTFADVMALVEKAGV